MCTKWQPRTNQPHTQRLGQDQEAPSWERRDTGTGVIEQKASPKWSQSFRPSAAGKGGVEARLSSLQGGPSVPSALRRGSDCLWCGESHTPATPSPGTFESLEHTASMFSPLQPMLGLKAHSGVHADLAI
ncbi:hypothetical protein AAFF_G00320030 [Aldrovandia affinis]|uniref:Uncharacterized protein n=1 Tax=Aldrovandia affinis TaxID=143900 RepID=A0AAD7SMU8_9TELE|nr:hypothetical protein AAFF_G00320030 [Aldrovandia affinis]